MDDPFKAEKSLQDVTQEALSFLIDNHAILLDALEKRVDRYEESAARMTDVVGKRLVLSWAEDVRKVGRKLDALSWTEFAAMREHLMKEKD